MESLDLGSLSAPARLAVGIVSAGRVGTALGVALERVGHVVAAATARSGDSRARLQRQLPEAVVAELITVARRCELLVLAVPDSALVDVITQLDEADAVGRGHIVLHTAGAFGADVLRPFHRRGAVVVAAHPAMTFTGGAADVERLADCGWAVTSPDEVGEAVGQALVLELGGRPVLVAESRRALYHAALAHGSNHLVTLVADALDVLREAIWPDPDDLAPQLLGPLLRASLENALASGDAALTGPVMRGDAVTVRRHLDVLGGVSPEHAEGYRALAQRTNQRRPTTAELRELLAGGRRADGGRADGGAAEHEQHSDKERE